ncbi:unnamed protein product, partial [Effrenium voratum]
CPTFWTASQMPMRTWTMGPLLAGSTRRVRSCRSWSSRKWVSLGRRGVAGR